MNKYLQILKTSIQQEFAYRLSFIMWRVRNVIQILVFYFLWESALTGNNGELFGYDKSKIFAYALLLIIVRAIVLSSRSVDVAGMVAKGDLINLLLKPIDFFKYWLARDFGSKLLNISFGIVEILILIIFLKPDFYIQTNIFYIIFFLLSLMIACLLYFVFLMIVNFVPFWVPEISWGAQFLFSIIFVEFLSGSFFPLDVFPDIFFKILTLSPFPYLIFIPIKIYLGAFSVWSSIRYVFIGAIWLLICWRLMNYVWRKGLLIYEGVGK